MTKKAKSVLVLALIAATMALVTCKPIDYYLQRVYKAYGRVIDTKGDPLESVEVFVKGYQYSELTNGLGDYEIELAEGTWTLEFAKEGYATVESEPFQVGPSPSPQRKEVNATLTADYIGIWFASNVETPGPEGPAYVDAKITINTDGTYETLMYNVRGSTLQNMSSRGTYACSNNIFAASTVEVYDGAAWVSASVTLPPTPYSVSEDGNMLTLFQDFGAIWTLTRQ